MKTDGRETNGAARVVTLRSAGGVVAHGEGEGLRIAVMRSTYGTWVLPKGGIEQGETPEDAARREIGEEIGIAELESLGHLSWTEHHFERDQTLYRKRVDWFLFTTETESALHADPEQNALDVGWFAPEQALKALTHPNQRRVVRRALTRLRGKEERGDAAARA